MNQAGFDPHTKSMNNDIKIIIKKNRAVNIEYKLNDVNIAMFQ